VNKVPKPTRKSPAKPRHLADAGRAAQPKPGTDPAFDAQWRRDYLSSKRAIARHGTIAAEDMRDWISSWDTAGELPLPKPRKR
jgi:hypothetical protein